MAACEGERHRVHRAADLLRRVDRRRESAGHLGRLDHGRRTEEDLGAGAPRARSRSGTRFVPSGPNEPIALFGAGTDSGTFDYFTEAIVGKAKSSRGDYTASEDDNTLVQGIEGNKYALGYLPYSLLRRQAKTS